MVDVVEADQQLGRAIKIDELNKKIKALTDGAAKAELEGKMSGWLWGIGKGFIMNKISKKMTRWVEKIFIAVQKALRNSL